MSGHTSSDGADAATGLNVQQQAQLIQAEEEQVRSRRHQLYFEAMRALTALVTVEGGVLTPDEIRVFHEIVAGVEDAGIVGRDTHHDAAPSVAHNVIGRLVRVNPYVAVTGAQEAVAAVEEEEFATREGLREARERLVRAVTESPGSMQERFAAEAYERSGQRVEISTACLRLVVNTIDSLQWL